MFNFVGRIHETRLRRLRHRARDRVEVHPGRRADAQTGIRLYQVKLFVFTQLNLRVIEWVMAALEQPMSRAHWVMHKWGYTGSGCIPMTLHDAVDAGKLAPGDVVAFCASGGGFSMAASFFRWTAGGRS
jgi:3-oxoacyl-[acyl-carrier-protein] synthase-3